MTNNNEILRDKAKACNSNIEDLIKQLINIQKDISEYVNKSNAIDALEALNMPINPMIAFKLIEIQIRILCDSLSMGEQFDKVVNSLQTVTNAFNKDMFGDDNSKSVSLNDIPKDAIQMKGKFSDVESFLSDIEDMIKMMEEEEGENNE